MAFNNPYKNRMISGAPPGFSLTQSTNPWAKPPRFTTVDDALGFVIDRLKNPQYRDQTKKLIYSGTPISVLARTTAIQGFSENLWNPDIAELIRPALMMYLTSVAIEDNDDIPFRMSYEDPRNAVMREVDEDYNYLEKMKTQNPKLANMVMNQMKAENNARDKRDSEELAQRSRERFEKKAENKPTGSFLNTPVESNKA